MRHNIHKDITITNKQLTQPTHQICKVKRLINFFYALLMLSLAIIHKN